MATEVFTIDSLPRMVAADYLARRPGAGAIYSAERFISNVHSRPLRVCCVRNVKLLGRHGLPVSEDGVLLKDLFQHENVEEELTLVCCSGALSRSLPLLKGDYLPLYGKWADGFWHWMMEHLPLVVSAEAAGFHGTYIVPAGASFIADSMQLLGIPTTRICEYRGGDFVIENLYLPERVRGEALHHVPGLLEEMRDKLLASVGAGTASGRRIYISRNEVNRPRHVLNESALMDVAGPFGFEKLHLEKLSLKEQIRSMAGAEALIGPHGAGMVHALFMQRRGLVVELFSPLYINYTIMPILACQQQRYVPLASYHLGENYLYGHNIELVPQLLELTLQSQLYRKES